MIFSISTIFEYTWSVWREGWGGMMRISYSSRFSLPHDDDDDDDDGRGESIDCIALLWTPFLLQ